MQERASQIYLFAPLFALKIMLHLLFNGTSRKFFFLFLSLKKVMTAYKSKNMFFEGQESGQCPDKFNEAEKRAPVSYLYQCILKHLFVC